MKLSHFRPFALPALLTLLLFGACQSTQKPRSESTHSLRSPASIEAQDLDPKDPLLQDSLVEISYVLGHSLHQFKAQASALKIHGVTSLDRQPLKEGEIDPSGYLGFIQKMSPWMDAAQRQPASEACRAPFSVTLRIGNITKSTQGCRTQSDGTTFSRIAREAEFLLYSKN